MVMDFRRLSEELERISSGRLALRPVCLADAWSLYEATRNPNFNAHLLWPQPDTEGDVLGRIDAIVEASRRGRMAAVSAVVKKTGEWVSLYRFQPYRQEPTTMEMGIWTHDRFWHGRYSLELVRLCIDAAFSQSDVQRLVGAAAPENRSSCQLMKLVGMAPDELVTRETEDGAPVVLQEFGIRRSAWQARTGGKVSFFAFPRRAVDWTRSAAARPAAAAPAPRVAQPVFEELIAA